MTAAERTSPDGLLCDLRLLLTLYKDLFTRGDHPCAGVRCLLANRMALLVFATLFFTGVANVKADFRERLEICRFRSGQAHYGAADCNHVVYTGGALRERGVARGKKTLDMVLTPLTPANAIKRRISEVVILAVDGGLCPAFLCVRQRKRLPCKEAAHRAHEDGPPG